MASGGWNFQLTFQIPKDDAVVHLNSKFTSSGHKDWKSQFSFQRFSKAMPKNAYIRTLHSSSHASSIAWPGCWTMNFHDTAGFRVEEQISFTIHSDRLNKQETLCFVDHAAFDCADHRKFLRDGNTDHSWEKVRSHGLETDMESTDWSPNRKWVSPRRILSPVFYFNLWQKYCRWLEEVAVGIGKIAEKTIWVTHRFYGRVEWSPLCFFVKLYKAHHSWNEEITDLSHTWEIDGKQ